MRPSSGYSLIEVLVVLVLIGLFTGLASLTFPGELSQFRFNHAVRMLRSDLRWARQTAITEGAPVSVVLDLESDQYRLETSSPSGGSVYGTRDLRDQKQGFGDIDLVDSSGGEIIKFQPNGTTTNWTTITLRNMNGKERKITVILTGRVKVL